MTPCFEMVGVYIFFVLISFILYYNYVLWDILLFEELYTCVYIYNLKSIAKDFI